MWTGQALVQSHAATMLVRPGAACVSLGSAASAAGAPASQETAADAQLRADAVQVYSAAGTQTIGVAKFVTQGLHSMDAFLERRENDKMREYKKSSATKDNMSSIVPFVVTTTERSTRSRPRPVLSC